MDSIYRDGLAYLTLTMTDKVAYKIVDDLIEAPTVRHFARDIFRAAGIEPNTVQDYFVFSALHDLEKGVDLGPILIYRTMGKAVIVSNFYHLCAVYHRDKYAVVDCKVV